MFEEEEDDLLDDQEAEEDPNEEDELEDGPEDGNEEEQMDYYMQQHPELLLALDIAAFRRQQMQQRLQSNNSSNPRAANRAVAGTSSQRSPRSLFPEDRPRDNLDEDGARDGAEESYIQNQRINLYGNLALAGPQNSANNQVFQHQPANSVGNAGSVNLGVSMGVNIGSYGYQNGRGNLLSQINYSNSAQNNNQAQDEAEERAADEEDQEDEENDEMGDLLQEGDEDDCEDEEEEYDSQNDEGDGDENDDDDADEEGDDIVDEEENDLECYLRNVNIDNSRLRARTAPLRPMEHVEQFKMTPNFTNLEQAAVCAVQIVQRNDQKFDLDSFEGQNSCKKFLGFIEKLCESLEIKSQNRTYRKTFSNAYKVLYKEGKLCYLTEILDSAQEAFPYLYVNGEKYVFSKQVIDTGKKLFKNFCQLLYDTKESYQRICEE